MHNRDLKFIYSLKDLKSKIKMAAGLVSDEVFPLDKS